MRDTGQNPKSSLCSPETYAYLIASSEVKMQIHKARWRRDYSFSPLDKVWIYVPTQISGRMVIPNIEGGVWWEVIGSWGWILHEWFSTILLVLSPDGVLMRSGYWKVCSIASPTPLVLPLPCKTPASLLLLCLPSRVKAPWGFPRSRSCHASCTACRTV